MRALDKDLRSFLLSQTNVTNIVREIHVSTVPESPKRSYIWLARSGSDSADSLGDTAGAEPFRQYFDLECISDNLSTAQSLADAVCDLFPMRGTLGSASVQGAFVTTQDDSYVFRGTAGGKFSHIAALSLEIIP